MIFILQIQFDRNPPSDGSICYITPSRIRSCQSWSFNDSLATSPTQSEILQTLNSSILLDEAGDWFVHVSCWWRRLKLMTSRVLMTSSCAGTSEQFISRREQRINDWCTKSNQISSIWSYWSAKCGSDFRGRDILLPKDQHPSKITSSFSLKPPSTSHLITWSLLFGGVMMNIEILKSSLVLSSLISSNLLDSMTSQSELITRLVGWIWSNRFVSIID